jgi:hypothetical protein
MLGSAWVLLPAAAVVVLLLWRAARKAAPRAAGLRGTTATRAIESCRESGEAGARGTLRASKVMPVTRIQRKSRPASRATNARDRVAGDQYTPAQRSLVDARLAKALASVQKGRTYGPFETHEKMMQFLEGRTLAARLRRASKPSTG